MGKAVTFSGIMPANILPFRADLSIDEPAYRRHLRWLADTPGVTGIVANGHGEPPLVSDLEAVTPQHHHTSGGSFVLNRDFDKSDGLCFCHSVPRGLAARAPPVEDAHRR